MNCSYCHDCGFLLAHTTFPWIEPPSMPCRHCNTAALAEWHIVEQALRMLHSDAVSQRLKPAQFQLGPLEYEAFVLGGEAIMMLPGARSEPYTRGEAICLFAGIPVFKSSIPGIILAVEPSVRACGAWLGFYRKP